MKPKAVANHMNSQTYHCHRVASSKASAAIWWYKFLSSSLIWKARSENNFASTVYNFFLVLVRFFSDFYGCSREPWSF